MTEEFQAPAHEKAQPPAEPPAESTGNPAVDDVVDSLEGLDDATVSEQVAVFESAHERLRGALSDAGDDRS